MKQKKVQYAEAKCPGCGSAVEFMERPDPGDFMICPWCRSYLEVIALSPLRLDWLFDREEAPSKLHA